MKLNVRSCRTFTSKLEGAVTSTNSCHVFQFVVQFKFLILMFVFFNMFSIEISFLYVFAVFEVAGPFMFVLQ